MGTLLRFMFFWGLVNLALAANGFGLAMYIIGSAAALFASFPDSAWRATPAPTRDRG